MYIYITIEAHTLENKTYITFFFKIFSWEFDNYVDNDMKYFDVTESKEDIFSLGFSTKNYLSDVWCLPEIFLILLLAMMFLTADLCCKVTLWELHAPILKGCLILLMPQFTPCHQQKQ